MTFQLHPAVALAPTNDGAVLLDERRGTYWQLNQTGTQILLTLLAGNTPEDVAKALASRHGEKTSRIAHDLNTLVQRLTAEGLGHQ